MDEDEFDDHLARQLEGCLKLVLIAAAAQPGPFLRYAPGDAPCVCPALASWEICSDGAGKFDLWDGGDLIRPGLSLTDAVGLFGRDRATTKAAS